MFRSAIFVRPISKDSIAEVFVHNTAVFFDDVLACGQPRTDQHRQFITQEFARERCEILDIGNEKPAWDFFDLLLQRQHWRGASRSVRRIARLTKSERVPADGDLIAVPQSSRLVDPSLV